MPAKSQAQRAFIYGVKGKKFAEAHGFDNKGPLPARAAKKPMPKPKKKAKPKKMPKKKGY